MAPYVSRIYDDKLVAPRKVARETQVAITAQAQLLSSQAGCNIYIGLGPECCLVPAAIDLLQVSIELTAAPGFFYAAAADKRGRGYVASY